MTGQTMGGIDYESIIREQMTGIARRVLEQVACSGLPGGHRLYLEFLTTHSGVQMPDWLLQKYPDRIGIILEHQFWNLRVGEDSFSVGLAFSGRNEVLTVPFSSLFKFSDEPFGIGLKFMPYDVAAGPPPPEPPQPVPDSEGSGNVIRPQFGRR